MTVPTLETAGGEPLNVKPDDPAVINRDFSRAMADDGPDAQAPPKRPAKPPAARTAPKPRRGRPPKAEQARTAAAAAAPLDDTSRAKGVEGLAQVGAGIALLLAKATGKDAFKADAVTIVNSGKEIADACVQTAHADPKFAAALDRVCAAGPYAALITTAVGVVSQIARNHRPALVIPGTVDPAELLKAPGEKEKTDA